MLNPIIRYRIYERAIRCYSVHKTTDGRFTNVYTIQDGHCDCNGHTRHKVRCKHLKLVAAYENRGKPLGLWAIYTNPPPDCVVFQPLEIFDA